MRIDCFDKIKNKDLVKLREEFNSRVPEDTDLSESEQRAIGQQIVVSHHQDLINKLNDFKNKVGIHIGKTLQPTEIPDKSKDLQDIEDKYEELLKQEITKYEKQQPGITSSTTDSETAIASAQSAIKQAESANTPKKIDEAIKAVEANLTNVTDKLTELYKTEGIEHESPNVIVSKQAKKQVTAYAKKVAGILGWSVTDKSIYANIAPAGGYVAFRLDIPGGQYQMYANVNYEPDENDDYAFKDIIYRVEKIEPGSEGKAKGVNQWEKSNISSSEMAQIFKAEALKYGKSPEEAVSEIHKLFGLTKSRSAVIPKEEQKKDDLDSAAKDFFGIVEEPKGKYRNFNIQTTDDGISYLSESSAGDYSSTGDVQRSGDTDKNFNNVITVWNTSKDLQFSGSTKVKSHKDVAHIMQLLENKLVEHAFAVHVDAKGNSHIQFLSIGGITGTVVDPRMVLAGVDKFNTKKLYLVHNHPSGNLIPSKGDIEVTKRIYEGLQIPMEHLIMDTLTEEYTVMDELGDDNQFKRDKELSENTRLTTHIINEQKIFKAPVTTVTNTDLVGNFIQQLRFTAMPKNAVLLLDKANHIIGNYVFKGEPTYTSLRPLIAKSGASSLIFYGNENNYKTVKLFKGRLAKLDITILDYVVTGSDTNAVKEYYKFASEEGWLQETQEKYGTNLPSQILKDRAPEYSGKEKQRLDPEKIQKGIAMIGKFIDSGVYNFSDIIKNLYAKYPNHIAPYFDSLKAVYSAYYNSQATEEQMEQMDPSISGYQFSDLIKDNQNDTGTRITDKPSVGQRPDGLAEGQPQGTLPTEGEGQHIGPVGGIEGGEKSETGGTPQKSGFSGGSGRRNSEGQSDVPVNGNEKINEQLGGESQEQHISKPVEQEPVVTPLQHNGNFVIPTDFTNKKSFNVGQHLQDNIAALQTIISLGKDKRKPTYEEQQTLFKYVGWGNIKEILFDPMGENEWSASNIMLRPQIQKVHDLLKELDEENYKSNLALIKASTANAYYTSIPIIRGIYNVLRKAGFKGGTVLEPSAGIGNFIGSMPIDMLENSNITAIEKDNITGLILKNLYPNILTKIKGYQNVPLANNSIDLIISNIPFGNTIEVYDPLFERSKDKTLRNSQKKVHSYFFARAIEHAAPNGIVAFVSSTGILDSKDNKDIRTMIAGKAEFMGAIRLPEDAFKGNAGTSVVTDIVFLRKFAEGEEPSQKYEFANSKNKTVKHKTKDVKYPVSYNEYYHQHPEMILGKVATGGLYGEDDMTVIPSGANLETAISDLAGKIFTTPIKDRLAEKVKEQASKYVKEEAGHTAGNIVEISPGVYGQYTDQLAIDPVLDARAKALGINPQKIREDDITTEDAEKLEAEGLTPSDFKIKEVVPLKIPKKYIGAVKDLIPLRKTLNELYAAEYGNLPDIEQKRKDLNTAYERFVKNNGTLYENKKLLDLDTAGANLSALEKIESKKVVGKADIFTQRIIEAAKLAESADNISDAISINLSESGKIDINRLAELLNTTPEKVIEQGEGIIFKNPLGGFETKDNYLTGNVRKKLKEAQIAAAEDPFYERNVTALEKAQPTDLMASQIYAPIYAPWINEKYVQRFASEIFNQEVQILRLSTGRVAVTGIDKFDIQVADVYGTTRRNGFELMEEAIQNRMPIVKDTYKDLDGKTHTVVNEKETQLAIAKFEKIKAKFDNWIWKDDARRNDLVSWYNQNRNNIVLPKHDGGHLSFPGYAGELTPRQHQLDGIWMIIKNMGGILDHSVGSGKTLIMVLAAMKMKQMGMIKKPILTGLKANTADVRRRFEKSYPLAKVLFPKETDFTPEKRRAFFAKMANNDWDAIVMTHDQFGKIPQSVEIQQEIMQQQIDALDNDVRELKGNEGMSKRQLKGLEDRKNNLQIKLDKLSAMDKDPSLKTFEEMGIDFMFVDESQQFKNLAYNTIQNGISGLGVPAGSQKAFNMLIAARTLQRKYSADKGILFASGTPISNTIVEMYNLFNYLRPNKMKELGIHSFDQWANTFARTSSQIEFGVTNQLKPKVRMREFVNVPEMSVMYREIADVRNDKNLPDLKKPKLKQTLRVKTDKNIPQGEEVTIDGNKYVVLGRLAGLEKNEYWVSLKAVGKDQKVPQNGVLKHNGADINYSVMDYSPGLLINIPASIEQLKYGKRLIKFAQTKNGAYINRAMSEGDKKSYMLLATNLAAKMAIDMRLIDPNAPNSETGKIGKAADLLVQHYHESSEHKGIQLVFSDIGTPKTANQSSNLFNELENRGVDRDTMESIFGSGAYESEPKYPPINTVKERIMEWMEWTDIEYNSTLSEANDVTFNVYEELKKKLIARGIPENEIAFIHDYKSDAQREQLFEDAKDGKIRFIVGSTAKLGTGVNVQDRVRALYHIDAPWRPSDMEQRIGRGARQGNWLIEKHYHNEIPTYFLATENTLDAYKYQLLDGKSFFINQAKTTDNVREITEDDGDEENGVSYAAYTAMMSGNPVILEKSKAEKTVKELESAKRTFEQELYNIKDKIARDTANLDKYGNEIVGLKKDKELFDKNAIKNEDGYDYNAVIGGQTFSERDERKEESKKGEKQKLPELTVNTQLSLKDGTVAVVVALPEEKNGDYTINHIVSLKQTDVVYWDKDQIKERFLGEATRSVRRRAGDKLVEMKKEYVKEYNEKYPNAKYIKWFNRQTLPKMSKKIGEINGFNIMVSMAAEEAMEKGEIRLVPEVGIQSPVSDVDYKFSKSSDPISLASGLQREIRDNTTEIAKLERWTAAYKKDIAEKQAYMETLPSEFPKQKQLDDATEKLIRVDERLKEISEAVSLPSMNDLKTLGEPIYEPISPEELENVYAIIDNQVSRINTAEDLVDAQGKNAEFFIYNEENLPPEDVEGDDAEYSVSGPSYEDLTDMQEVVKELVDDGTTKLKTIQDIVAKELQDDSQTMRDLVEKAYSEYTKYGVTAVPEFADRIQQTINSSLGTTNKINIVRSASVLKDEADKLKANGKVEFQAEQRPKEEHPKPYDIPEVAKTQIDPFSFRTDQPLKLYRGIGGELRPNFTYVNGKYFTPNPTFAANFGKVHVFTMNKGVKVFNFDMIKKGDSPIPSDVILDPQKTRDWLQDNGYDATRNTNTGGVEYVILNESKYKSDTKFPVYSIQEQPAYNEIGERKGSWFQIRDQYGNLQTLEEANTSLGKVLRITEVSDIKKAEQALKRITDEQVAAIKNPKTKQQMADFYNPQPLYSRGPEGEILGFEHNNKIYINGKYFSPNTLVHEAGHIWTKWIKENDPRIYQTGMKVIEGTRYLEDVKANDFYQAEGNKIEDDAEREQYFKEEALNQAIGDKGGRIYTEAKKKNFVNWLKELWEKIKAAFGFKGVTDKELEDMTLDEFTDRANAEILKGEKWEPSSTEEKEMSEENVENPIHEYEMTTTEVVKQFLSGRTIRDAMGAAPEGDQTYLMKTLNDMLMDGEKMINIAQGHWGYDVSEYGRPLLKFIKNEMKDAMTQNKKVVLLASLLGNIKEEILRNPAREYELNPLDRAVTEYYQKTMNDLGQAVAAGAILKVYRDKYMGDIFADQILEEQQIKEREQMRRAEDDARVISDKVAQEVERITSEQRDAEEAEVRKIEQKVKTTQSKKAKFNPEDAKKIAKAKLLKLNANGGIQAIIDKIKKLDC